MVHDNVTVITVLSVPSPSGPSAEAFPPMSESSMLPSVLLTICIRKSSLVAKRKKRESFYTSGVCIYHLLKLLMKRV
jgi:hypothetical protein